MAYAEDTSVSVDKSQADIRALLRKVGADTVAIIEGSPVIIAFGLKGANIAIKTAMPARIEYRVTPTGLARSDTAIDSAWKQACRARWRALYLVIKAKLEAVEAGIETTEQAFLAHIQLDTGQTVGEATIPQLTGHGAAGLQLQLPPPRK